jgi:hypothetical protein
VNAQGGDARTQRSAYAAQCTRLFPCTFNPIGRGGMKSFIRKLGFHSFIILAFCSAYALIMTAVIQSIIDTLPQQI